MLLVENLQPTACCIVYLFSVGLGDSRNPTRRLDLIEI